MDDIAIYIYKYSMDDITDNIYTCKQLMGDIMISEHSKIDIMIYKH